MCLGIPGQITAITDTDRLMAMAEISGVRREVNVACIADPHRCWTALSAPAMCRW